MPLLEIWKATKDSVLKMNLETIVKMAGDGQLMLSGIHHLSPRPTIFIYAGLG